VSGEIDEGIVFRETKGATFVIWGDTFETELRSLREVTQTFFSPLAQVWWNSSNAPD
jgi:hypothetical protein